jgi:hypothetical protein
MRGLPPPPADVAELRQYFDINGHRVSTGFWLFSPEWPNAVYPDLEVALVDWFTSGLPQLLGLQHSGVIPTTCLLRVGGLALVEAAPPSHGAWTGGQADNVALGIAFKTNDRGKGATHINYVPGVPDVFISANYQISQVGWGNLQANARDLLAALNTIRSPLGLACVAGTLRRARGGLPLGHASFSPFAGVVATPQVVTIRRRIPRGYQIASS